MKKKIEFEDHGREATPFLHCFDVYGGIGGFILVAHYFNSTPGGSDVCKVVEDLPAPCPQELMCSLEEPKAAMGSHHKPERRIERRYQAGYVELAQWRSCPQSRRILSLILLR